MSEEVKKQKPEKKQSLLTKVFKTEYKYDGLILAILAVIAIVFGVILLKNDFGLTLENVYLIGDFPEVFCWALIIIGIISLLIAVWPFYKPSYDEFKRVSWPTRGRLLKDSLTVIIFSAVFALYFLLADSIIKLFTDWLATL